MTTLEHILSFYPIFKNNPIEMLMKRFNIPQGMNKPEDILQHLLNTGQVNQEQINKIFNLRNDPLIQKIIAHN